MNNFNISANLNLEHFFKPVIDKLREKMREEMEKHAAQIITEEMAKFAIDLARIVSFQDFKDQLIITIKKELK